MNNTFDLWVEKYRPDTLDGYVFKNKQMEEKIKEWVTNPTNKKIPIPHILFSGKPGTGKTTAARMLCNELNVDQGDIMEINASRENNVETVREKIGNFCHTWPIGGYKVIILDEFDGFSPKAQMILRGEVERHSDSVRFILTANYKNKIIPALMSRFQSFNLDTLDLESYVTRVIEILQSENVDFDVEILDEFINTAYPDLRKCINTLDQHVVNGVLTQLTEVQETSLDYLEEAVELFKSGRQIDARKLIVSNANQDDYDDIYRFFYKNPQIFSETQEGQDEVIVLVAKGLRNHTLVADQEINLAATIIELCLIGK